MIKFIKITSFLLFYTIPKNAISQSKISISNTSISYPQIKGNYVQLNTYPGNRWTGSIMDEDTNSYYYEDQENSHGFWIVRINNFWHVEEVLSGAIALRYRSVKESIEASPNCNIKWQIYNKVWYDYGNSPVYVGEEEYDFCISLNNVSQN